MYKHINLCKFCTDSIYKTMNDNIQLNDHKQDCGSASAEDKCACVMPSASKFAAGKAEYPPMHNGEFDILQTYNYR